MVYLIHFDRPFKHARHYLGSTRLTIEERLERHRSGTGAVLLKMLQKEGIGYRVVRIWKAGTEKKDRKLEKKLKRQASNVKKCPVCNPEKWNHFGILGRGSDEKIEEATPTEVVP